MDTREQFNDIKNSYLLHTMSDQQIDSMVQAIEHAKEQHEKKMKSFVFPSGKAAIYIASIAACVLLFVVIPNISVHAANAMSEIPIIGNIVRMVTIRNYTADNGYHSADITTTQIDSEEEKYSSSIDDINNRIQQFSERYMKEYQEQLNEGGYSSITVNSEVISTSEQYFTLRLFCLLTAADSAEISEYYTIDLNTGEQIKLADLFQAGSDYITPISDSIKSQMRSQMEADDNAIYFIDRDDFKEWEFTCIDEDTHFYVNKDNHIVIEFDQGEVAPMYMGSVEFIIPDELINSIRL